MAYVDFLETSGDCDDLSDELHRGRRMSFCPAGQVSIHCIELNYGYRIQVHIFECLAKHEIIGFVGLRHCGARL